MAREHIQTEMRRQKRDHYNKLFTYYWHRPYEVVEKYSDLTYKVKNKATGVHKVVHVDRMKRKYKREEPIEVPREGNEQEVQVQETDKLSHI